MSANNDNAMTRFLFAILKQKCLKDIDWNKVAHDPILAQEITNGHAARMRYSRFRSAMLGLEPQKRNRNNAPKSKVTKSKKESKGRKEEPAKQDPTKEPALQDIPKAASPKIKEEACRAQPASQLTPASMMATPLPDTHTQLHNRLLTPCSDSDLLGHTQGYMASPASEMLHSEPSFDFTTAGHCNHDHESWSQSAPYQTFGMPYELDSYGAGFCEHQHTHHHPEELCVPSAIMEPDPGHANVKHEEWDTHYHGI